MVCYARVQFGFQSPSILPASRSSTRKNVSQRLQESKSSTLSFDNDVQEMIEVSPGRMMNNH
jgi:hypothetical protein